MASVETVVLVYEIDKGALNRAKAGAQSVSASIDGVSSASKEASSEIRDAFSGANISSKLADRLKEIETQAQKTAKSVKDATSGGGGRADRSAQLQESLDQIETAGDGISAVASSFGELGGVLSEGTGLAASITALGKNSVAAGVSVQAVGASMGAVALATAALMVAFEAFKQSTKEAERGLNAAIAAQRNYYSAVATLDEQGAKDRITQLQRSIDAQRQLAGEARRIADSAFQQATAQFTEAGARALFAVDSRFSNLSTTADSAAQELANMEAELTRLNQGLEQGAFTANNAADAQERLRNATQTSIQRQQDVSLAALAAQGQSAQALADTIANNQRQIEIYQKTAQEATRRVGELGATAANDIIRTATAQQEYLRAVNAAIGPLQQAAKAQEAQARAASALGERIKANAQRNKQAQDKARADALATRNQLVALAKQTADARAQFAQNEAKAVKAANDAQAKLANDAQKAQVNDERAHKQTLQGLQDRFNQDAEKLTNARLKVETDYNKAILEATENLAKARLAIDEEYNATLAEASLTIDAQAVARANRERLRKLRDADTAQKDAEKAANAKKADDLKASEDEAKERQKTFEREKLEAERQYKELQAQRQADYNTRLNELRQEQATQAQERAMAQQERLAALQAETNAKRNALMQQGNDTNAFATNATNALARFANGGNGAIGQFVSNALTALGRLGNVPPSAFANSNASRNVNANFASASGLSAVGSGGRVTGVQATNPTGPNSQIVNATRATNATGPSSQMVTATSATRATNATGPITPIVNVNVGRANASAEQIGRAVNSAFRQVLNGL